jgi:hypothetical protein
MHKEFPIQKCVLIFFIVVFLVPQFCFSQDTTKTKKQRNHLSFFNYTGLRWVDQEIPMAMAVGIGTSYQTRNHYFSFRALTQIWQVNKAKNFMRVSTWNAPVETIHEFGFLYRLYQNKKKSISFDAGLSYINGFNHGNIIIKPSPIFNSIETIYNRKRFRDVGIPIEIRFSVADDNFIKGFICSASNLNFIKSYTSLMFLFQITIPNHDK